jgi:hypothetical protein
MTLISEDIYEEGSTIILDAFHRLLNKSIRIRIDIESVPSNSRGAGYVLTDNGYELVYIIRGEALETAKNEFNVYMPYEKKKNVQEFLEKDHQMIFDNTKRLLGIHY